MTPVHEVVKAFLEWRDKGNRALVEGFTRDEIVHAMVKEKIRPNTGDHELHLLMTMRLEELKELHPLEQDAKGANRNASHVFISYVHENEAEAQRLADELTQRGLSVWLDKNMIKPGSRWQDAIAEAIDSGDFFIACFSKEYNRKNESYMNKEIGLAIERLSNMPHEREWFIPVLFSGTVPKWRIRGGETLHDIQWVELSETNWDIGIRRILQVIQPPIHLRSTPLNSLEDEDVKKMLQQRAFFDKHMNHTGSGIKHQYELSEKTGKQVVIDHRTGLTWQRAGSAEGFSLEQAYDLIRRLNEDNHAGFADWRLPTIEEAMCLMEPRVNEHTLFINPFFDKTQGWIWTADLRHPLTAWSVSFFEGSCGHGRVTGFVFVRAVR